MRTFFFQNSKFVLNAEGHFTIIDNLEALVERIDQRFLLFKNKYFMGLDQGVPYIEEILKKPVDPGLVAAILNTEILKEAPEVTGVGAVETTLDRDTRIFNYNAEVLNIYGDSFTSSFSA